MIANNNQQIDDMENGFEWVMNLKDNRIKNGENVDWDKVWKPMSENDWENSFSEFTQQDCYNLEIWKLQYWLYVNC